MTGKQQPISFGKYRGLTFADVSEFDPQYVCWVSDKLSRVKIRPETLARARKAAAEDSRLSVERQNAWAWGFGRGAKASRDKIVGARIRLEHEARRRAGQEACTCFPHGCSRCRDTGWLESPEKSA